MNYLDEISRDFTTLDGMDNWTNLYEYETVKQYFRGDSVLELGCADGAMTKLLLDSFNKITVIDGSEIAITRLLQNINECNIQAKVGYFEEIEINEKYDTIIMGHILEHVDNPIFILNKFKEYLVEGGVIIITVPNAKSFHRIAAVKMGMLKSIYELNRTDIKIGHKRVYDWDKLTDHINMAELKLIKRTGYWLKFLSNKQIEDCLSADAIKAYMDLGTEFVNNAAEIVAICEK